PLTARLLPARAHLHGSPLALPRALDCARRARLGLAGPEPLLPPVSPRHGRDPGALPLRGRRRPRRQIEPRRPRRARTSWVLMIPHGFLGSRADLLVDLSLVTFVILPGLIVVGVRLAARRRFRAHRTVQAALLATMTLAVALLEIDIRINGGT